MFKGSRPQGRGFTLVEVMIVVAIIGVIAAIAIPAFSKYLRRGRTSEAVGTLGKMWTSSVSYYETDHIDTNIGGVALPKQFPGPSGANESGAQCGCLPTKKCPGGSTVWNTDLVWVALNFTIPDPHSYMPAYSSAGAQASAVFTAASIGDLDCDGTLSTFMRRGNVTSTGDVSGASAPNIIDEME